MKVVRKPSRIEVLRSNEPARSIKLSRKLSGALWLEIEGCPGFTLKPEEAFKLAAGIFKGLGIEFEYGWDGRKR